MHNLVVVAFVDPVFDGQIFPREDWPLHITLLRFDLPADPALLEQLQQRLTARARSALGRTVRVGPPALFGRQENLPVSLIQPHRGLQLLHERLCADVLELDGRIASVRFTGAGYRPHITHHRGRRPQPGRSVALDQIALVDLAPGGDHSRREVLCLLKPTARA